MSILLLFWVLDELVGTIEELTYVTTKVFMQNKFTSWVKCIVEMNIKNLVVDND